HFVHNSLFFGMHKITPFQVIILGVFGVFLLFSVLIFSGIIPLFKQAPTGVAGEITIWGALPSSYFDGPLERLNTKAQGIFGVKYIEKQPEFFDSELVEELASGRGPDVVLLPHDLILRHKDKVIPISYEELSVRAFIDTFVEEGELYLGAEGVLAVPFSIDPLVMYVNRDMFSSASLSKVPTTWDEFFTLAGTFTKTDSAFNIKQSTIALGEFRNILHAKEILALLIMQGGNPIVSIEGGKTVSILDKKGNLAVSPAESAVRFYTEFSNPAKSVYSWNRSLPSSKDMFLAGDLAVYFGFASEFNDIRIKSPHLNFDVALVPQTKDVKAKTTYGNMTGFAVLKQSKNPTTAFYVASIMTDRDFIRDFAGVNFLPPVRRDLLAKVPGGAFESVFYSSALIARAWLDPAPAQTFIIFSRLVENVTSGRERLSEAITRASQDIGRLLPQ
ncbi:MAG: extracellular solute-binding protein, partial [bacterium]|nr:extracellular solute-binding protein [bacterium]